MRGSRPVQARQSPAACHRNGRQGTLLTIGDHAGTWHHPGVAADDFVFPGGKLRRSLSGNAMLVVLRRFGLAGDVTVHEFRSSSAIGVRRRPITRARH